jgi:hypothetical protein
MTTWVILLEWEVGDGMPIGVDAEPVRVVLSEFADCHPVALAAPDRYAVQLEVEGDQALDALSQTIARHRDASDRAHLNSWTLVRVEVMTRQQFDEDISVGEGPDVRASDLSAFDQRPDPVRVAETALRSGACPHAARDILCRMIRELGGGLVSARLEDDWTLPVDVSFGTCDPLLPVAEPWSIARSRIEEALPRLVETARMSLLNQSACVGHEGQPAGDGR